MKKIPILLVAVLFQLFSGTGNAKTMSPNPFAWEDDIGAESFSHGGFGGSIEAYDILGALGGNTKFGFYFTDNPGNLITVFDHSDQTTAGSTQSALINFSSGIVRDIDDGFSLQSVFTPSSSDVGFFYSLSTLGGTTTIYTEHMLNPLKTDLAAAFQSLSDPDKYLIGFENSNSNPLYFGIVNGVTAAAVPEPVALWMLALGAAGTVLFLRKRTQA